MFGASREVLEVCISLGSTLERRDSCLRGDHVGRRPKPCQVAAGQFAGT